LWRADAGPRLTADAGPAYAAAEGEDVTLSAAGSSAPPGEIVSYEWDFNYNGVAFDVDAAGVTAVIPGGQIDGPGTRTVAVRVRDAAGATHVDTALLRMTNVKPTTAVVAPPTGNAGEPYALALAAQDPGPDLTRWRVEWGDGTPAQFVTGRDVTPAHTYATARAYTLRVTPMDEDGSYPTVTATVTISSVVAGRYTFYNNSFYDGQTAGPSPADDRAIAAGKAALRPGGRAAPGNVTHFSRGINGIIVDLAARSSRLAPTAADFIFKVGTDPDPATWQTLAAAPTILFRPGAGAANSDRVYLVLPDGVARNAWLQVTVLPSARTALVAPDVFYFGNLVGETGDAVSPWRVTAADVLAVRRHSSAVAAPVDSRYDINQDGKVNALDVVLVRMNLPRSLRPVTAAPAAAVQASIVFSAAVKPL